jgi:demethylmenaquinone methyltransferase/2-methoxy-6-polyprenyl-1,4-benzoquinol methylase
MIEQAKRRCRRLPQVTFRLADAFSLQNISGPFTAAFGIWWWSHVPRQEIPSFLATLHHKLTPGARVLFSDQLPYEAAGRCLDGDGNIIETRYLPDGRTFEIVKNFPTAHEVVKTLERVADNILFVGRPEEKNWTITYTTKC